MPQNITHECPDCGSAEFREGPLVAMEFDTESGDMTAEVQENKVWVTCKDCKNRWKWYFRDKYEIEVEATLKER